MAREASIEEVSARVHPRELHVVRVPRRLVAHGSVLVSSTGLPRFAPVPAEYSHRMAGQAAMGSATMQDITPRKRTGPSPAQAADGPKCGSPVACVSAEAVATRAVRR